jgi:hypothetical protein
MRSGVFAFGANDERRVAATGDVFGHGGMSATSPTRT